MLAFISSSSYSSSSVLWQIYFIFTFLLILILVSVFIPLFFFVFLIFYFFVLYLRYLYIFLFFLFFYLNICSIKSISFPSFLRYHNLNSSLNLIQCCRLEYLFCLFFFQLFLEFSNSYHTLFWN